LDEKKSDAILTWSTAEKYFTVSLLSTGVSRIHEILPQDVFAKNILEGRHARTVEPPVDAVRATT
jgi:hypothetical protein